MIKNYLLLLALCFFSSINAQIINIPDANFKAALVNANDTSNLTALNTKGHWTRIDLNGDGEIQQSEALSISILYLPNKEIISLEGIEEFKNLKNLECSNNKITSLDLQDLLKLEQIVCSNNSLTELKIENLSTLRTIDCAENKLVSLDLHNLINLEALICRSNYLINLNITGLSKIFLLDYSNNKVSNLDISNLLNLQNLSCASNEINSLNLDNLENLEHLFCANNNLSNINLSNLLKLKSLSCYGNFFTNIDVDKLTTLTSFSFGNYELASIDVKNLSNLNSISVLGTSLIALDLSACHSLNGLLISGNSLLESILLKNGSLEKEIIIESNESLKFVCADDDQISDVKNKVEIGGQVECHVNSYCSFIPGGVNYVIKGNARIDSNNNGCDALDIPASFLKFRIDDGVKSGNFISNETGKYEVKVPAGNYKITPVFESPSYFSVSPTEILVDFPTVSSPKIQDFCIKAEGVHNDLEVIFLPVWPSRPGFTAKYKVIYKNKGNVVQSGTVSLGFDDSVLDLINSNPAVSTTTSNKISWNFSNLKPFESREIVLNVKINSPIETLAINNGDILSYTASIISPETDELPIDNTFIYNETVLGSYDPNDKTCLEGNVIKPELIGEYVHYLIRFENTGTYKAENVVIKDIIDLSKFDISTLVPTSASHSYITKISDGNKVEFIFQNIDLPFDDANNDGYIAFKIKTLSTLSIGDSFANEANIYFDYNFPILTNKETSTFKTLGTQDFEFSSYFYVYPNPSQNFLNITSKDTIEIQSMAVYNLLGQLVLTIPNAQNASKIDTSRFQSGNYILQVKTDKGSSAMKFIKI